MSRVLKGFAGVLAGCMLWGVIALADNSAAILETYTGDSHISVYVRGMEADAADISVQIATTEADQANAQPVSKLSIPMQTFVMVDNSQSISAVNRDKIAEFLQDLISDRLNNEEICIATFGEEINVLNEYTSDYGTLKQAVGSIAYQDQETYLTDVLYDLISSEYAQSTEDVYRRIIVISDGVDNKSLGYTKDELYLLLKEVLVPVYTVGCVEGKNGEELESMFALSRMTSADYFLLDEVEDVLDITNALKRDREVTKLTIKPLEEMLDGSKKAVKLTFSNGQVLTTEVVMPQQIRIKEPEESLPAAKEVMAVQEEPPLLTKEDEGKQSVLFPVIGGAAAVMAVIFAVLFILKKKKHKKNEFEVIDDNILNELDQSISKSNERTEMIDPLHSRNNDDGNTVMIWNQTSSYQVVLTDINLPAKSFRVPLNQSIIVGRRREWCDIVLDYETSVSGRHCEIVVRDGKFVVKDLQSANGTYLNGSKVLAESEIFSGNTLKLGRLEMRFEVR